MPSEIKNSSVESSLKSRRVGESKRPYKFVQDRAGDWQKNITLATAAHRGQQLLDKKRFRGVGKTFKIVYVTECGDIRCYS